MSKEAIAIKALEALARLGNGDQYGNSTGNVIARTALFEIAEQPAQPHMTTNLHDKMLAAIDAYFSASDAVEEEVAENLLLDVRDEINKHKGKELLHKLAAKSLTEGLRLDDWDKIGCVNHDCDKCKALAEQPAQPLTDADYYNACLSYRHDFGLMSYEDRQKLVFEAKEWARAFGITKGNT